MKSLGLFVPVFVVLASSPSAANVVNGGSPELFLRCSDLFRQNHSLKAEIENNDRRAGAVMAEHQQALSEVKRHEAEASRLEKIADIMRNSDDVQWKYRRAVRRYKEAFRHYDKIRQQVAAERRHRDTLNRNHKSVVARINSECVGTWNNAILNKFCGSGDRKHQRFCSNFPERHNARRQTPAKDKVGKRRRTGKVECVQVLAERGWQRYRLRQPVLGLISVSGGWSVDKTRYKNVRAGGHTGADAQALAPYNGYKFNKAYPFGALLMEHRGDSVNILPGKRLPRRTRELRLRINDTGLGDNAGYLNVCFI